MTRRNVGSPGVESSAWHQDALDTSRSYDSTFEIDARAAAALIPLVDEAIGRLPDQQCLTLTTWAWFEHSPRSVMRRVEREVGAAVVSSNRQILTAANLAAARLALVPLLAGQGIYL